MAVLGASGSGKSTLIDALANRISKESIKGRRDPDIFQLNLDFLDLFQSRKKKARVEVLIDQLGLRGAANTVIGDEGHRGVSGGERRRVSIGIDIIHDPIILFLDEPTSGLDSTSAFMVVKVLQRIAQSGSIVVMTIHQPSSRILNLLDRLIFLSRGQTVFTGTSSELPLFYSEFGCPIPEGENRTEFALDHIQELEESSDGPKQWLTSTNPGSSRGGIITSLLIDSLRCLLMVQLVLAYRKENWFQAQLMMTPTNLSSKVRKSFLA
uniref:AAA+ ATPase domain-containing protein n=1 Tax=Chenopodium quinoa TaxID=63459 RepID=A0A803NE50_CHEQI